MVRNVLIALALLIITGTEANISAACPNGNFAFKNGEVVDFNVYYTVAGIYVHAGKVKFTTSLTNFGGKPAYHVVGIGNSIPSYDWVYKVRDRYETYIDTSTMLPMKFVRNVDEGGYKINETVYFNHQKRYAVSDKGTFTIPSCVQDVLSEVFLARNMDFDKVKPGTQIPFDLFLDNKVYNVYVRYLGIETIKTRFGTFRTYKFRPLLLEGSIFKGGEQMTVWVTADKNRLPVRIESPIIVGSIKVDMMGYQNLRNPMDALIRKR